MKLSNFTERASRWARQWRKPDVIVNGANGLPYLLRWHLIPRNRFLNIYLHKFMQGDDDRAYHDHPWASISILLKGRYNEELFDGTWYTRKYPWPVFRWPSHAHRIFVRDGETAWTLFITGPRWKSWGFLCPQGWKHWRAFGRDGGCGEP